MYLIAGTEHDTTIGSDPRTPNSESQTPKCSGFPTEFGELYKRENPLERSRNFVKEQNK
jgi:hypothetical protein